MELHPFMSQAARTRSASTPEMVAAVLREAILASALPPGAAVRQDEVAAQLGVSKIPVREALRRLEGEGLVVFHPNRGVTVTSMSRAEAGEITEMRVALETLALRHGVAGLKARDLRRAGALLEELDHEEDPAGRSALNWEFHAALYAPAARPLLLDAVRGLHVRVERYMRLMLSTLRHHGVSQREHRALLEACAARDTGSAVEILAGHIRGAGSRLDDYLARQLGGEAGGAAASGGCPATGGEG